VTYHQWITRLAVLENSAIMLASSTKSKREEEDQKPQERGRKKLRENGNKRRAQTRKEERQSNKMENFKSKLFGGETMYSDQPPSNNTGQQIQLSHRQYVQNLIHFNNIHANH
jgi:hypothetical protein